MEAWLSGIPRSKIANRYGVSEGTVTNIIDKWRLQEGIETANSLRDLAVILKKTGMTPWQCAQGFRISMIMKYMGVTEDFETDLVQTYKKWIAKGMNPEILPVYFGELHSFLDNPQDQTNPYRTISIHQTLEIIDKKKAELDNLREETRLVESEKSSLQKDVDRLAELKEEIEARLKWECDLVEELKKKTNSR